MTQMIANAPKPKTSSLDVMIALGYMTAILLAAGALITAPAWIASVGLTGLAAFAAHAIIGLIVVSALVALIVTVCNATEPRED